MDSKKKKIKTLDSDSRKKLAELLYRAVWRGDEKLAKKRLRQGASPSEACVSFAGRTPLMAATMKANGLMVDLLLPMSDVAATDAHGETALILGMYEDAAWLLSPAMGGSGDWIDKLASPAILNMRDAHGDTPLMIAAGSRCLGEGEFKKLLVKMLPDSNAWLKNKKGQSALALAVASASQARALALWAALEPSGFDKSALAGLALLAARMNMDRFLLAMASAVDLEERDEHGRTPLLVAARACAFEAMAELLDQGADPHAVDADGCNALMLICESRVEPPAAGQAMIARLANPESLSARDQFGESALDKARDRKSAVANRLRAAGATDDERRERPSIAGSLKLQQLLLEDIICGDVELARRRIAQGADPAKPLNERWTTALVCAASTARLEMVQLMRAQGEGLDGDLGGPAALAGLLERGSARGRDEFIACARELADPDALAAVNSQGETVLMQAAAYGQKFGELLALFGPGSDWLAKDFSGASVVEFALNVYEPGNAMLLWLAHPDKEWAASATNKQGQTLAHVAAARNADEMLLEIVSFSNFEARDGRQMTPLMLACFTGGCFESTVRLLAPWSDCKAADAQGCDALMLAIEQAPREGYGDFVGAASELVRWADLEARDFLGESALDKAVDREFLVIEAAIRARMAIDEERLAIGSAIAEGGPARSGRARSI